MSLAILALTLTWKSCASWSPLPLFSVLSWIRSKFPPFQKNPLFQKSHSLRSPMTSMFLNPMLNALSCYPTSSHSDTTDHFLHCKTALVFQVTRLPLVFSSLTKHFPILLCCFFSSSHPSDAKEVFSTCTPALDTQLVPQIEILYAEDAKAPIPALNPSQTGEDWATSVGAKGRFKCTQAQTRLFDYPPYLPISISSMLGSCHSSHPITNPLVNPAGSASTICPDSNHLPQAPLLTTSV